MYLVTGVAEFLSRNELGYTTRPYAETIHDQIAWLKKGRKNLRNKYLC